MSLVITNKSQVIPTQKQAITNKSQVITNNDPAITNKSPLITNLKQAIPMDERRHREHEPGHQQ
jgi:hypothetical protein